MSMISVAALREILERRAGLDLGRGGMETNLISFVQQRLVTSGLSFERYLEQLEILGSDELRLLVEAMTVVYTWFFRDPGQFCLISQLIQDFPLERKMGIWVAGCATGEEPYSVALVAAEHDRPVDILGTDLNSQALRHAEAGRYCSASLDAVDATMRSRYLTTLSEDYAVPESVKQRVRFQVGNLVDTAPRARANEGWDLVICRNVLIYFGQEQARRTLDKLANSLAPGGYLVLGASEAILERPSSLQVAGVAGRAVLMRPRFGEPQSPPVRSSNARLVSAELLRGTAVSATQLLGICTSSTQRAEPIARANTQTVCLDTGQTRERRTPSELTDSETSEQSDAHHAIALGHTALEAGDIPRARDSYLRAVVLDPTCAEALMFAGIAHYLDGALPEALHHLRGALCLDASLWAACFYQALCYENMGYAEDAARSYSQVVRIASTRACHPKEHPFLKGWQHDLLAVARKRAHEGLAHHVDSRSRLRTQGGSR